MSDEEAVRHIAHLVMLDRHWPSAFVTASRQKADTAVNLLAEAFGYDRVSMMSVGEGDLAEFRETISLWRADPRLQQPPPST